ELVFLDTNQLNKIYTHDFRSEKLNRVKSLFLFQCFTGLAYIDLKTLTAEDIKHDGKQFWIIKERQKSGVTSNIPLTPEAISIFNEISFIQIDKISNKETDKDSPVIKCLSNQKFNLYLKEMSRDLGIEIKLTTHVARKTFATMALNNGKVSIESVAKMLGHANTKVTQSTYTKVLNSRIENEMKNFRFIETLNVANL
ncbi:MAG: integrase catalytic domain-containing protein, partial [Bacteroidetes bacterium]|nr:integrase catalytic domain-containing protein [Bacteroidota bacterium]